VNVCGKGTLQRRLCVENEVEKERVLKRVAAVVIIGAAAGM
jgi:hypothetical protein